MTNERQVQTGQRLRELRGEKPQREIAEAVGVSTMTISDIERGKKCAGDDLKIRLAAYYGKTVGNIFFNEG